MTNRELVRILATFEPDSEVALSILQEHGDFQVGRVDLVYWDTDAKQVTIEGQGV